MALHTRLDSTDVMRLARQYQISVLDFHHITGGCENTSYYIASSEKEFILTVLENRSLAEAEQYSRYLRSLKENRLPVPQPIACGDMCFVAEFSGKPVIMSEYIRGIQHDPLPMPRIFDVGVILATLHLSPIDCPLPPHLRLGELDLKAAASFADRSFGKWLVERHQKVAHVVNSNYPLVATHGDPFPDNMIVAVDGQIILLDWDDGAKDNPLFDLGMAILGLCSEYRFSPERLNRLLDGYRSRSEMRIDRADLLNATIYVALYTAYNRYLRQHSSGIEGAGKRSYKMLPALIDSIVSDWNEVNL